MANLTQELTARIEEYRATNKNPCKNYATEAAAEKATAKIAQQAATYFDRNGREDAPSARYVVFYIEAWGRWVGCVDMTELLRRDNCAGGYIGFCGQAGFFCF